MAIIKCPECGQSMSDSAKFCPHCGYQNKKGNNKTLATVLLFCSVICLVGFGVCLDAHTGDSPKGIIGCISITGFFSCILGAAYQYRKKHVITTWLLSHRIILATIILCACIGGFIFFKWATYSPPSPSEQMRLEREYNK